jgi:hypothetical protein
MMMMTAHRTETCSTDNIVRVVFDCQKRDFNQEMFVFQKVQTGS